MANTYAWWADATFDRKGRKYRNEESEPCKGCGCDTFSGQRAHDIHGSIHDSGYCEQCRELCGICEDWIGLEGTEIEAGQLVDFKRVHKDCWAAHLAELEYEANERKAMDTAEMIREISERRSA